MQALFGLHDAEGALHQSRSVPCSGTDAQCQPGDSTATTTGGPASTAQHVSGFRCGERAAAVCPDDRRISTVREDGVRGGQPTLTMAYDPAGGFPGEPFSGAEKPASPLLHAAGRTGGLILPPRVAQGVGCGAYQRRYTALRGVPETVW